MGLLPFPGAIGDQPAWVVEAFRECDEARAAVEAASRRRQEREFERASRGR
jgi:hypothetical protein